MSQISRVAEPIPGYVLKERIGVGGYGEVWSVQAPGGLSKAIKFVYGHFDDERAAREMRALNRIKEVRHPFLLSLERIEIIEGQLIIVTELADMSLKDRFEQAKKEGLEHIPREELLGYLRDAADALDHMSTSFSLQHLDVKPENLLLVGGRVKVADFGLVKELHDVTASMMGGLTPVYAPPEVFDGRPSQRSDQYSLAIVYQEMLTAVLPFPGRTAAQLASQHLHARPRLAPLPAGDQPVIAKALSKDPAQRFPSCRALVDALSTANRERTQKTSADSRLKGRLDSTGDTTSIRSRAASTDHDWQRSDKRKSDGAAPSSANLKTMVIGDEPGLTQPSHERSAVALPPSAPVEAAIDLAPLELPSSPAGLRPTLFLGIGGTATRTLRQLRRQIRDRFAADISMPAVQMLLLDTDARNLYQATQGDCETALADFETVALPLRNAQDYAADAGDSLNWLSRRWLYNIPRSLQTEGRRPLGRLALVDHADQVFERLRKVLATITSKDAIAATSSATGMSFESEVPQVFLISSISGGTGGGMVLDVAYAVRTILADSGLADDAVYGILTHSTDRNPTTSDLATANAYACLSELYHYSAHGGYPGDVACGLPLFSVEDGTFSHVYFVHLGDNLNDEQFVRATDDLASYLYLNTVSNAGGAFQECRKLAPRPADDIALRTFGMTRVGTLHSSLPELTTELICHGLIDCWRGAARGGPQPAEPSSLIERVAQRGHTASPTTDRGPAQCAAEHAAGLQLDVEPIGRRVRSMIENQLGGDAQAVLSKLAEGLGGKEKLTTLEHVRQLLGAMHTIFGAPLVGDGPSRSDPSPLQDALDPELRKLASPLADAVRDGILALIELPDARVSGAAQARQWYDDHLRAMESQSLANARQTRQELMALEHALLAIQEGPAPRKGTFGWRRAEKNQPDVDSVIERVIGLQLEEATAQGVVVAARIVLSRVKNVGDQLKDLQRELSQLAREFEGASPWTDASGTDSQSTVGDEVRATIVEGLRAQVPRLVQSLDARFQKEFLEPEGGLRRVLQKSDALGPAVRTALRRHARRVVVQALGEIPIDNAIAGPTGTAEDQGERLQVCLRSARPQLNRCGGSQRLLAILPDTDAGSKLAESLSQVLDPRATLVRDTDADLVFCYETQEILVPHAAARLIGGRGDLVQIAARLHTRTDVAWTDLASAGRAAEAMVAGG